MKKKGNSASIRLPLYLKKKVLPSLRAVTREVLQAGFSQTAVYATRLQEGACLLPSFKVQGSAVPSSCKQKASEGWALKEAKRVEKFNENRKSYLQAKFNIGQASGRKLDPEVVAKEMRRARAIDGERLFLVEEFLSPQQISSFFSRMAAKVRQQPVTDQDVLAVEEQVNFCLARDSVLSSLQICHPIVVDQYDICALVKSLEL